MPNSQNSVSPSKLAANRANAAKSTGPRTLEGKTRSAQNARKHGFTASMFAVVRLEDLNEVANLKADLLALYRPVNSQEIFALERLALAQQALLRAARLEVGLFTTGLNESYDPLGEPIVFMNEDLAGNGDIQITRAQNRNFLLGEGFHRMVRRSSSWALFLRYQAQAERNYRRAVEDFDRLKAQREELQPEEAAPPEELPNEPTATSQPEQTEPTCAPGEMHPSPLEDPDAELLAEPMLDLSNTPLAKFRRETKSYDVERVPDPWEPGFAAYAAMCRPGHRRLSPEIPGPDAAPPGPGPEAPPAEK